VAGRVIRKPEFRNHLLTTFLDDRVLGSWGLIMLKFSLLSTCCIFVATVSVAHTEPIYNRPTAPEPSVIDRQPGAVVRAKTPRVGSDVTGTIGAPPPRYRIVGPALMSA
jgi:hypothetical protein